MNFAKFLRTPFFLQSTSNGCFWGQQRVMGGAVAEKTVVEGSLVERFANEKTVVKGS